MPLFKKRSAGTTSGIRTDVDRQIEAYEKALRLIDSPGKWSPEKTAQLVAIVQPVAPSFTEAQVREWVSAVIMRSVGHGGDPEAEAKAFLREQIGSALQEFKRIRTELK
jgi:hypothetical protein